MTKAPFIHPEWEALLSRASRSVNATEAFQARLEQMEKYLMATLDQLKAEVSENSSVVRSAVTLIRGLADKLREANEKIAAGGQVDYSALVAELDQAQADLAAAVAENTVADSQTPEVAEPPIEETVAEIKEEELAPAVETPPAEPTP